MRFKQNVRVNALNGLRSLIHANDISIDVRADTIIDYLARWRKSHAKGKTIVIPEVKPIADEINILDEQNATLRKMLSDLEALILPDLGDEKGSK